MADITGMLQAAAGGGNPNAWDISNAVYDFGANAWDVAGAKNSTYLSIGSQEATPRGLFFKPDGTKMYIIGTSGDDVNEYSLSTAWNITTATYVQNFSVSAQEITPNSLSFKPDGTKMYVLGASGDDVNEYSLSTAWNISTASYVQNFSIAAQDAVPSGLFFKPDGTRMYVLGLNNDNVNEYSLGTAWNISTASYVQAFSVSAQDGTPRGLFFKSDGTVMYVIGGANLIIIQYSLSTAWDVSSASFSKSQSVTADPSGLFFKPDGSEFFVVDSALARVYPFAIGGFSVAPQDLTPEDLFFKPDGTKMYIVGNSGNDVNEYSLSIAWDVYSATFVQNFSVAGQETLPLGLFFKTDGTSMYTCGQNGESVYEYSLSIAWDISTASYVRSFSVAAQDTVPTSLSFKPDGTKMYVLGDTGNDVNEYSLSTAWNISTASYVQNFSVSAQDTSPEGLYFRPDGTKMYVLGNSGKDVNEYTLSTAWNISTASYVQNFSVAEQADGPLGLFFKPDGTQFFIVDANSDKVFPYTIE